MKRADLKKIFGNETLKNPDDIKTKENNQE